MVVKRALLSFVVFLIASIPFSVFAADTNFFGPIIAGEGDKCYCPNSAMDWGCVLAVVQKILNAIIAVGLVAVVFFVAWAGFSLITSGSNPGARTKAKNRLLNGIIGIVLILTSFLIVDTVMKVLYNPEAKFEGGSFGNWNELLEGEGNYCIVPTVPNEINHGTLIEVVKEAGKEVIQPGTETSSTGGKTPAGTVPGSFTYDNAGIKAQTSHASGALTGLLSCMSKKLPAGVGKISSISDSAIQSGKATFETCAAKGTAAGCAHKAHSCHYGGNTCVGRSQAVDFGDETNATILKKVAAECGATYSGFEGDHLHVSVGKSCGCN
ncbi:MAG: hypothetical protein AB203_00160 [Parcubacteria bacterium C7867-008]|nr:MAG: hypothetical protein AB203_00160 [Parcubacteria bacterium C7867-008]